MSDRPRAVRRRQQPSLAARVRALWIIIVLVVCAIAAGAYAFITAPQFRTGTVDVHVDGKHVTAAAVLAAAHIDPDGNAWLLNTNAIEARVEAIPYVATANVIRTLPAAVELDVTERVPAGCVVTGSATFTVDTALRVLEAGCRARGLVHIELPREAVPEVGTTVADPAAALLVADIGTLAAAHVTVTAVRRDKFGGLVAVDPAGIELLLGPDDDLAHKATLIGPVRAALAKGRAIKAVDLRAPGTPTVEFRN